MKIRNFLTVFFTACIFISNAQLGVIWNGEQSVSDGSVYGRQRPRMALTSGDIPVILYGKTGGLYVSRWNGSGFDAPVSIMPVGMQTYIADWTGPDIAAKGDTVIVVFKAMPLETGNVYSVRSIDGGVTFSDTIRVDSLDSAVAWMPSLDITEDGNPVVSYMIHDVNWTNPRYVLARSADAGLTYNSEITVVTSIPGEACDCCPSEMVIDGTRETLLFRNNENNTRDIFAVFSNDGGTTFPYQNEVDGTYWYITSCPSTGPHGTFVGNELITAFTTGASGNFRTALSVSDVSGGFTFNNTFEFDDPSLNRNFPRITSGGDTVLMTWREYYGPLSDVYVAVASGGNYADLLQNGIQAAQDPNGVQTNPDIIYRNGVVHFCYQDNNSGDVKYRSGTVGDVTGLSENKPELFLTPNPCNGNFVIPSSVKSIRILDPVGQEIPFNVSESGGNYAIRISEPASGIYLVAVISGEGKMNMAKLVVK